MCKAENLYCQVSNVEPFLLARLQPPRFEPGQLAVFILLALTALLLLAFGAETVKGAPQGGVPFVGDGGF